MPAPASPHLGSASQSYALAVLEYVERLGMDPVEIFGREKVDQARRQDTASRLGIVQWQGMLQQACRHLNDPAFPIKLAATIQARHLGMLGFLLMSCDTLGSAALTLQRYEQLLDSVNAAEFDIQGERCTLTWRPLIDNPPPEFIMLSMSLWAHQARWLVERPDLVCDIDFTFAAPAEADVVATYQSVFGGKVRFGQSLNQMVIPLDYLSLPVAQRDAHVHASLKQQAEADLQRLLGQEHGFVSHLEAIVADQLQRGSATLQQVASALDMAPRTLQSRLEAHGLGFRELLDRVRHRQAERHLRNPDLTLAEVAALLGFSDQSAFQHAFKRWTGASPGDYRRRLA
ncbi:MAG TPA: AraC family transcriptional regulator ligand-binding domain-containing protein [Aquabacterium sp.]|uniref:AraC family transcriptional regulator n=1 Tax=Aquabacterium sp. TaxID=1872578 RepID=UPI002E308759|nr:AraC family transcriptional regulator ligand-binding domain-containing protein [Aquabacterium sp.]HEX5371723.1 AraC family transcriptional regulator ligand-binding domain-containing protein [Aquabacterium sp.]